MNLQAVLADFRKAQTIIGDGIEYLENVVGASGNVTTIRNTRTVNRTTALPGKRKLSAAAKARISQAMKARWEARKAGKKPILVGRGKAPAKAA
jgi:hypothetical protein